MELSLASTRKHRRRDGSIVSQIVAMCVCGTTQGSTKVAIIFFL